MSGQEATVTAAFMQPSNRQSTQATCVSKQATSTFLEINSTTSDTDTDGVDHHQRGMARK